jgi:general stress protein 26
MQERRMAVIEKLLESAENVIAGAEHCWLVTLGPRGRATARPMGRVARRPVESDWTLSFLADARSKKVSEIRAASEVRLIFERDEEAFVTLAGHAAVIGDAASIAQRWRPNYDRVFPSVADKANAVFLDIRTEDLRFWIRGLTPEPFGHQSLTMFRSLCGDWCIEGTANSAGGPKLDD